jgi:RNA polymerase sigma-70 factor (ECF subfamily)
MSSPEERVRLVQALMRHQAMVKAYAYAIVRDFHLAEDVFQDVATIVAERWEAIPSGEDLARWLHETTRRKALEALRKRRRAVPILSESVLVQLAASFRQDEPDLRDALSRCLGKLSRVAREIVEGRYGEGLACEQIASRLRRSVQSVYAIIKRARMALSECVDRALAGMKG